MKRNFSKLICLICAALLIAATALSLVACNKAKEERRKKQDAAQREASAQSIEGSMLSLIDESWKADMSDPDIVKLSAPGDYVVAREWIGLFADTLKASSLQTAKLKNLADAMTSQDGQSLLTDFANNAQLLLPVFRKVGFTEDDISSLVYDLLCSLVKESGRVLDEMMTTLGRLRASAGLNSAQAENLRQTYGDINAALTSLVPSDSEKQTMLVAFENAKAPMTRLVGFAYGISVGTFSDELWGNIFKEGGALDNVSDDEVDIIVNALLSNVSALKLAMTRQELDKLNVALGLIIDNFDVELMSSALYAQIVVYAKYAYMVVDAIPAFCDLLTSVGSVIGDPTTLSALRQAYIESDSQSGGTLLNWSILSARIIEDFMGKNGDKTTLNTLFDDMLETSGAQEAAIDKFDMDKAILLLALDLALNLTDMVGGSAVDEEDLTIRHADIISIDDVGQMFAATFNMSDGISKFKNAYYSYKRGEISLYDLRQAAAGCNFDEFGVQNMYAPTQDLVEDWYNYYMNEGLSLVRGRIKDLAVKATEDIKKYVEDYYADGSEYRAALGRVAAMQFTAVDDESLVKAALPDLTKSGVIGIVSIITLIMTIQG